VLPSEPVDIVMPSFAQLRALNEGVSLVGKNILVVGGSAGIGAAAAVRFASLGTC
jgi:hypothetical protein